MRPILEYASSVWSPYLLEDIDKIEKVQRRFTKSLPGLRNKSYSQRLKLLSLDTLELRRLKSDLSLTYAILHELIDFDHTGFFTLHTDRRTRGHSLKLIVDKVKTNCRKFFFSNRITSAWNSLPDTVVQASSLPIFKRLLSEINLSKFLRRDHTLGV